jgi:tetratricopeptide (TPR) repeat protein
VDAILEGSVQRSGGRVRVTAQLIRASTDTHLWTGEFEGAATDVLTLQSDVAKAIAREIQVHVTAQESSRLARARPVDAEAHDAYLLGRSQFWQQNEASLRSAVDHFERAVELQPDNADAHAALSLAWGSLVDLGFSREEGARRSAAERALALDPDLSEAHAALALVKFHDWDWAAAEAAFRRARELNPDSVAVCGCYALALAAWSRFQEALDLAEHGIKVNPLSPDMQLHYGIVLYLARRFEEAVPPLKRAIELAPRYRLAYAILTQVHRQLGKSPEAVVLLDRPELRGDSAQGSAYAGVGRRAESLAIARALTAAGADPFGTAMIYFALGDRDRGFERLTVAFAQRQGNVRFINVIPLFDGVRADPRFQALVARLNLPR